jgi:RimJ/RimL family protein N-acetyltransferase
MTSTAFAPDASVPDWRPTLEGVTIVLRPIRPDDFDALHAVASDPAIWVQHPNSDRYRREVFEGFFAIGLASDGAFAVIERATGRMIGSSRFYDWCAPSASIVIGYTFLARDHWGGATNREMKSLMLTHAFRWARTVWFHAGPHNLRSRRALEKIGARFDREETVFVAGERTARAIYRIDRNAPPPRGP